MNTVKTHILNWFSSSLDLLTLSDAIKDPKTSVQEYQQANTLTLPNYEVIKVTGATNEQLFTVACSVPEYPEVVSAMGSSRRAAEQQAATELLIKLGLEEES